MKYVVGQEFRFKDCPKEYVEENESDREHAGYLHWIADELLKYVVEVDKACGSVHDIYYLDEESYVTNVKRNIYNPFCSAEWEAEVDHEPIEGLEVPTRFVICFDMDPIIQGYASYPYSGGSNKHKGYKITGLFQSTCD